MPLDPAFAGESSGYHIDPEVALSSRPMAGMAGVKMRLVDDPQAFRLECLLQFVLYLRFDRHDAAILLGKSVAP